MVGFSILGARNPLWAGIMSARGWMSGLPMVKCCGERCGQALAIGSVVAAYLSHGLVERGGPIVGSVPITAAVSAGLIPQGGTFWDGAGAGGAAPM